MSFECVIGESDPFVAQLLQRFAEESGLCAWRANSGQELMKLILLVKPNVIILEPQLPGLLRGWEVAKALKNRPETRDIPVITCSWLHEADIVVLMGRICGHLQKPDIYFRDFVSALQAAGIAVVDRSHAEGKGKTAESKESRGNLGSD
jgi:CheY-like chemotaxis protein